jgi:hypothetical protein
MRLVGAFNPLRGCNLQQAQYSKTPRSQPLFEHEDDFEAPGEGTRAGIRKG